MWIHEHTEDNKVRFVLGEVNEKTKKPLICFGINPSTAVPKGTVYKVKIEELGFKWNEISEKLVKNGLAIRINNSEIRLIENFRAHKAKIIEIFGGKFPKFWDGLDKTLSRVRNESIKRDYDGWIMLNIYPQREINPQDIDQKIDLKIHNSNKKHIRDVFAKYSNSTVWVAWGGNIEERQFLKDCFKEIVADIPKSVKWKRMGKKVGKKEHPHHPLYLKRDLPFEKFYINYYLKKFLDS